jgi:15-cis-phytoene synthase
MSEVSAPRDRSSPSRLLKQAERFCARLARHEAKNFYWGFLALPRRKRVAIYSLYDFARQVDDEVDGRSRVAGEAGLARQRERLDACLRGIRRDPVMIVLGDAVERYGIPGSELEELIAGCEMDLDRRRYRSWKELAGYCRRVAGSIGRMCVRIFGASDPVTLRHADNLGLALQLTNILRDVREDASMGRIYLPLDEMERFELTEAEMFGPRPGMGWERIVNYQIRRARLLYADGLEVCRTIPLSSSMCVRTMAGIYQRILEQIAFNPRRAFNQRVSLSTSTKLRVAMRSWLPG